VIDRPVLRIEGLVYRRGGPDGFDLAVPALSVDPGQALAVIGDSGSGKSTLLDIAALLRRPTAAERLEVCGIDAADLWRRDASAARTALRASRIGYVMQTGGLLPYLSVRENAMLPMRRLDRPAGAGFVELMARLGLASKLDRMPGQLSLGERQRVAIARALVHRPALVLADEPTASLDAENASGVFELLVAVVRDQGTAMLVASHDVALVRRFGLETVDVERHGGRSRVESARSRVP
jgi:putative ABC transport system ATP-binding protein